MLNRAMFSPLASIALLAMMGNVLATQFVGFDEKIYPATFCKPNDGTRAYDMSYSRHGYLANKSDYDLTVVCPLVRDQLSTDKRFHTLAVYYKTNESISCSFKSTFMNMPLGSAGSYQECDFDLPATNTKVTIDRKAPRRFLCNGNQMPDTAPHGIFGSGAYTLTCTLPPGAKLGHYHAIEP